ncbi:hypothetical protein ACHAXT_005234 [Thalassiosira profunda]
MSLTNKLNNVYASLRKEKEDALRSKQLAEERLRLAKADREQLDRKGQEERKSLRELREREGKMKGENGRSEGENEMLKKEYNFQHAELQSKKEKLSRLEEKRLAEASRRHQSLATARELLRRLREESTAGAVGAGANAELSPEERRRRLEQMMEADGGAGLCGKLPALVRLRKAQKEEALAGMEAKSAALRGVIAGYQNALGGASLDFPQVGGGAEVMQQ